MKKPINIIITLSAFIMIKSSFAGAFINVGAGVRPLTIEMNHFTILGVHLDTVTLAVTRPAAELSIGYDHLFSNGIYLGLAAFHEFINMRQAYTLYEQKKKYNLNIDAGVHIRLSNNYGGKIYFGFLVRKYIIFYTDIELLCGKIDYSAQEEVLTTIFKQRATTSHTYTGFAAGFGLGMLYSITDRLSLRAEYDYIRYPNVHVKIKVGGSAIRFTPKASINAVTIGLLYRITI